MVRFENGSSGKHLPRNDGAGRVATRAWCVSLLALAAVALSAAPAHAIPSPDLAVNFLASAGQVLGLLSVTIGGMLFGRKGAKAAVGKTGSNKTGSVPRWLIAGFVIVALGAVIGNVLQWASARDARNQRLEAALIRPSMEMGQNVGDVTLQTLTFSDQVKLPNGLSTDQLAELLADMGPDGRKNVNLIDVREPEEREGGELPNFTPVRYPDLLKNYRKYGLRKGTTTILLCFSGNRSSETCEYLRSKGIPCNFIVGGYEKWLIEGRPVARGLREEGDKLRAIAAYPNDTVLLDTPEVKQLVEERGALFVDVRFPTDFDVEHLPGAINMPIRWMTTPELTKALEELPRQPIIAPCYDKRSCFYAKILGLRLARAGFEYLGRYTVPQEFFYPEIEPTHIADWEAAQSRSFIDIIGEPLAGLLSKQVEATGSLPFAIFLVVVALRLLVLPFTAKAERDQVVMRRAGPEMAELRRELAHDSVRLTRAMRAFNRRYRLTPGLNMIGIAIQIPLFLAFFFAVDTVAKTVTTKTLWMSDLAEPDPLLVLPVLLGLLVFFHLEAGAAKRSALFLGLRLAASILLVAVTIPLSAAVNLYLVLSVGLMALQSMYIRSRGEKDEASPKPHKAKASADGPIVHVEALKDLVGRADIAGGKAGNLAEIAAAGFDVPDGFVITGDALCVGGENLLSRYDWQRVDALWKQLGIERAAVRSSGHNEDGVERSYAGVFKSVLDVDREGLPNALREVYDSFAGDSASNYSNGTREHGSIVVQKMVDADYAGVMFTEHPSRSGSVLIELVEGLGVAVVDGTADAKAYEFGRLSGRLLDEMQPPIALAPLLEIGRRLERLFGGPQDVEWAYKGGKFLVLQSRTITASVRTQTANLRDHVIENERHRLLEVTKGAALEEPLLVQNELSELLPRPTPLSLSFMEEMWRPGGSTDLACRALGIQYDVGENDPPYVNFVFGALYVNRVEEQRRMRKSTGFLSTLRLTRMAGDIEDGFRDRFLPAFHDNVCLYEAADFDKLDAADLFPMFEHLSTRFLTESYVQAHVINIAANFYFTLAERRLAKRGLSAASYLAHLPPTVVNRAMALLADAKSGRGSREQFLDLFGHRAPIDYELAAPRYSEDTNLVDALMASAQEQTHAQLYQQHDDRLPSDSALRLCIDRARQFQVLKEEAKHQTLREFAVLRRILLALDARLELGGDIFYLTLDEVRDLAANGPVEETRTLIADRKAAAEIFESLPSMSAELSPADLERLTLDGSHGAVNGHAVALKGSLVAGQAPIRGRARVATGTTLDGIQEGEILITRFMNPMWTPALPKVSGMVTEVGGWLSHAAILAREYNVPAVVGVRGAMERIVTGDMVQLNPDGSVELI